MTDWNTDRLRSSLSPANVLPRDVKNALLVGRAWTTAGSVPGPSPVLIRGGDVIDLSGLAPTISHLLDLQGLPALLKTQERKIGTVESAKVGWAM